MEENKLVQSITISLHASAFQTIFLEIHDAYKHHLAQKLHLNSSEHSSLCLGLELGQIQIVVKKNQGDTQILNRFKMCSENIVAVSIIEQAEGYLQVKTQFDQYCLWFKIFIAKSPFNQLSSENQQFLQQKFQQKSNSYINEINLIVKQNLLLLQLQAVKQTLRKQNIQTIGPPNQESQKKNLLTQIRKTKKTMTCKVAYSKTNHSKITTHRLHPTTQTILKTKIKSQRNFQELCHEKESQIKDSQTSQIRILNFSKPTITSKKSFEPHQKLILKPKMDQNTKKITFIDRKSPTNTEEEGVLSTENIQKLMPTSIVELTQINQNYLECTNNFGQTNSIGIDSKLKLQTHPQHDFSIPRVNLSQPQNFEQALRFSSTQNYVQVLAKQTRTSRKQGLALGKKSKLQTQKKPLQKRSVLYKTQQNTKRSRFSIKITNTLQNLCYDSKNLTNDISKERKVQRKLNRKAKLQFKEFLQKETLESISKQEQILKSFMDQSSQVNLKPIKQTYSRDKTKFTGLNIPQLKYIYCHKKKALESKANFNNRQKRPNPKIQNIILQRQFTI